MVLDGLKRPFRAEDGTYSALPGHLVAIGKSYRALAAAARAATGLPASTAPNHATVNGDAMSLALANCLLLPHPRVANTLLCFPTKLVNAGAALHLGVLLLRQKNFIG